MNHRIKTIRTKGGKTFYSAEKRDNIFCKWEELIPELDGAGLECWWGYGGIRLRWKYKFSALRLIVKSMKEEAEKESNEILSVKVKHYWL
jgi:hypothetical protein